MQLERVFYFYVLPVNCSIQDRSDNNAAEEAYNGCNIKWISFRKQPNCTSKCFHLVKVKNIVENLMTSSGTYYVEKLIM